jgi:hypothetical protein
MCTRSSFTSSGGKGIAWRRTGRPEAQRTRGQTSRKAELAQRADGGAAQYPDDARLTGLSHRSANRKTAKEEQTKQKFTAITPQSSTTLAPMLPD